MTHPGRFLPGRGALLLLPAILAAWLLTLCPMRAASPDRPLAAAEKAAEERANANNARIIAYYFHVTVRCDTCRKIERYSEEAIRQYFDKELKEGKIEWRPVNVQLSENRHFIKKYKLFTRSLIFALYEDKVEKKHTNLLRVWELVRYEKLFKEYVKSEMQRYLRGLR